MDNTCPICERVLKSQHAEACAVPHIRRLDCETCGEFMVSELDVDLHFGDSQRAKWQPRRLSALVREQVIQGQEQLLLLFCDDPVQPELQAYHPVRAQELLRQWPATVPERLDRALCNLARMSNHLGDPVELRRDSLAVVFAETERELFFIGQSLVAAGWLRRNENRSGFSVEITPEGWARFHELTRGGGAAENPAFVAMWFGDENTKDEMQRLYEEGIAPAVQDAGYRVARVDDIEHNEWIMDQVLAMIRAAPFVVADFTGHRNGVYFEAAFARGLNTPVIHCCKEGELEKAHFDTKQLNHVLWNTPEELKERLRNRILATIGQGPFPVPE